MNDKYKRIAELQTNASLINMADHLTLEESAILRNIDKEIEQLEKEIADIPGVAVEFLCGGLGRWFLSESAGLCFSTEPIWFDSVAEACQFLCKARADFDKYPIKFIYNNAMKRKVYNIPKDVDLTTHDVNIVDKVTSLSKMDWLYISAERVDDYYVAEDLENNNAPILLHKAIELVADGTDEEFLKEKLGDSDYARWQNVLKKVEDHKKLLQKYEITE